MGTNTQAMRSASSSAEEADEGVGVPGCFPFTVMSGGVDGEEARVNVAFAAYAKRSTAPGRTAREALALALAEVEASAGGEEREGADGGARVDEASYGVTRSPFARVSAPVVAAPAVVPVAAKEEAAPVAVAPKRRPALRGDTTAAVSPSPSTASEAVAVAAPVVAPASAAALTPGHASAAGGKISLRRGTPPPVAPPTDASPPVAPPTDASFLFGPVMDGMRSPLLPLPVPVASGEPGGAFVSPARVMTHSPFPVAAGSAGAGLAPLSGGQVGRPMQGRADAGRARRRGTGEVWEGRLAVLVVSVSLLVLAGYFFKRSAYWPFRMKPVAVAGATEVQGDARASSDEGRGAPVASPQPVTQSTVAALATPERPAPGAEFTGVLQRLKITGVLQGEPVRAIIDGRLVQAGDLVEVAREVRLVGLDVAGRQLIFEDRTTARASVRY